MAAKIINEHHACNRPSREESIWELAEMATSDILEFEEGLERTYETLRPLETLMPEDCAEEDEDGAGTLRRDEQRPGSAVLRCPAGHGTSSGRSILDIRPRVGTWCCFGAGPASDGA